MVFTKHSQTARSRLHLLLALCILSPAWMWQHHVGARHGQLHPVLTASQAHDADCATLDSAEIHLSMVGSGAAIADGWVENLLFNLEEDWEVFFALTPIQRLSSLDLRQSDLHPPLTLHLSCRARKLYLQHQSFLC
jgi:hypothetical protein